MVPTGHSSAPSPNAPFGAAAIGPHPHASVCRREALRRLHKSANLAAKCAVPRVRLILYQEGDGCVPVLEWLDGVAAKARAKCRIRLERLAELGHELRRPEADYLRDDVYELRAKHSGVNYRMLYFFHGTRVAVVSHGFTKQEAEVPTREIGRAIRRKEAFDADPEAHAHEEDW